MAKTVAERKADRAKAAKEKRAQLAVVAGREPGVNGRPKAAKTQPLQRMSRAEANVNEAEAAVQDAVLRHFGVEAAAADAGQSARPELSDEQAAPPAADAEPLAAEPSADEPVSPLLLERFRVLREVDPDNARISINQELCKRTVAAHERAGVAEGVWMRQRQEGVPPETLAESAAAAEKAAREELAHLPELLP